jgi:hypothetical protein
MPSSRAGRIEVGKITQIITAHDWFYVHEAAAISSARGPMVRPLAAFALDDEGAVFGLVGGAPKLSPIPELGGKYRHRSELTKLEIERINPRTD